MRSTHWTNIVVEPGRHRQFFDEKKFEDLKESIRKVGVIHLPVCREDGDKVVLVAGERRLRACADIIQEYGTPITYHHNTLEIGHVPYALWEDLDYQAAKEVELEENATRQDLTWQEHARAVAELHSFKRTNNPEWTASDTAQIVQDSALPNATKVLEDIRLAEHLEQDETLNKAKSRQEALKLLKRKLEVFFVSELGKRLEEQIPEYRAEQIDAIDGLCKFKDGEIDLIITDPPYGVNAQRFDAGLHITHDYLDTPEQTISLMEGLAKYSYNVTKDQSHLYIFCDVRKFFYWAELFNDFGWDVWPRPLIWVKDVGHIPKPNYGPRLQYECILFANKGMKPVTALYPDVLIHPSVVVREHAAQKPTSLYVDLLRRSCYGGELIVDPFCGSGTVFAAAIQLNCPAVGFDTDPAAIGLSKETIRKCLEQKKQNLKLDL